MSAPRTLAGRWALLLTALVPVGCKKDATVGQRPAGEPRAVQLVAVETEQLPRRVAVTGVLAAQDELVLALDVGGRLDRLLVDVGDTVAAGSPVAVLDPRDFDLAVERAEAAVVAAFARLGLAPGGQLEAFEIDKAAPVREAKAGRVEYRLDRTNLVHVPIGKVSFASETLIENLSALINEIAKARPSGAKGQYIRGASLASTMGPGVHVEVASIMALATEA